MLMLDGSMVERLHRTSAEGPNKKFLWNAHCLWLRYKNYEKSPPVALERNGAVVSLIYASFLKNGYAHLYEVVTVQGEERKGYAAALWELWIAYAVSRGANRLNISCVPDSIGWHMKNGLVFWSVDRSGSLRSDQPLFPTRDAQVAFRARAVVEPEVALPPYKYATKYAGERVSALELKEPQRLKTLRAIEQVGDAWLRPYMLMRLGVDHD